MAIERTLSIIKPDGVEKGIIGRVVSRFETNGLKPIAMKMKLLSRTEAEGFYAVHKARPFFGDLVNATGLLRSEVEKGLGELVAWGLVTSDSFAGLRAMLVPSDGAGAASRRSAWRRPGGGRGCGRSRPSPRNRPSKPWRGSCCVATAWCSGGS